MAAEIGDQVDRRPWLSAAVSLVGTAGASILLAIAEPWSILVGAVVILLSGAPQLIAAWWRGQAAESAMSVKVEQRILVKDALNPLAALIGDFMDATPDKKDEAFGKLVAHGASSCLLSHPNEAGVRVVIFAVTEDQSTMEVVFRAGRDQVPNPFVRGNPRGDKAFRVLESRKPIHVEDLTKLHRNTWAGSGEGYKTFITVPIFDSYGAFGMLSIDAPEPASLDRSDILFQQLVASMLALAFAGRLRDRQATTQGVE